MTRPSRPRAAHQLRPGRQGLSREDVAENQRARILEAVSDVISFKGYAEMTVEDIVATAGVSRRTFYDHFRSKEAAHLAAFEAVGSELIRRIGAAYAESRSFAGGVVNCLGAFLGFAEEEPRYAEMCIVEVLSAGPEALERRNRVMRTIASVLDAGAQRDPRVVRPPALTVEWAIGGVYEVVYARLADGAAGRLSELLPDLTYSLMLIYVDETTARELTEKLTGVAPSAH